MDCSGKRTYGCFTDAQAAARGIARRHHTQRPYRCPDCGQWHLTSQRTHR